jgi:hypothetical protein
MLRERILELEVAHAAQTQAAQAAQAAAPAPAAPAAAMQQLAGSRQEQLAGLFLAKGCKLPG